MRHWMLLALSAFFLLAAAGTGQFSWYHEGHGTRPQVADKLVRYWYARYLHRPAGNGEEVGWVQALQAGQSADHVLSGILGSTEFYNNSGGTPERFVAALYIDLNHKPPDRKDVEFWTRRLHVVNSNDLAFEMLTRYPQNWADEPYFPDDHRYDLRRPDVRPYKN